MSQQLSYHWWPTSLDPILNTYEQTFLFDASEPNVLHKYTHIMPFTTVVCYLVIVVFSLPKILTLLSTTKKKNRSSTHMNEEEEEQKKKQKNSLTMLKLIMAAWNLTLSVGSAIMFLGITIPYANRVAKYGFLNSMCDSMGVFYRPSAMIFWAHYFVLSKYAELLDTVLLIVKNPERPVPFLHYYHHSTVLLFSWYAEEYHFSVGFWFCMINALIHSFMYFYYFLTELGYRPSWAKMLTMGQIAQMVAGIVLTSLWFREYLKTKSCDCTRPIEMIVACILMYGSYLFLFVRFFILRYRQKTSSRAPTPKGGKEQ